MIKIVIFFFSFDYLFGILAKNCKMLKDDLAFILFGMGKRKYAHGKKLFDTYYLMHDSTKKTIPFSVLKVRFMYYVCSKMHKDHILPKYSLLYYVRNNTQHLTAHIYDGASKGNCFSLFSLRIRTLSIVC